MKKWLILTLFLLLLLIGVSVNQYHRSQLSPKEEMGKTLPTENPKAEQAGILTPSTPLPAQTKKQTKKERPYKHKGDLPVLNRYEKGSDFEYQVQKDGRELEYENDIK